MSGSDDFEIGFIATASALVLAVGVLVVLTVTCVLWMLHPVAAMLVFAPVAGGLANVAIQRARRKRGVM